MGHSCLLQGNHQALYFSTPNPALVASFEVACHALQRTLRFFLASVDKFGGKTLSALTP